MSVIGWLTLIVTLLLFVLYSACDDDRGFHGKARRVPIQPPPTLLDCDTDDADCTINEIRGELCYF